MGRKVREAMIDAIAKVINNEGDNHKAGITWGQRCGLPECPYLRRWVFNFGVGSVRVHHWTGSDDSRHLHDHAWWFLTFVVRGGYTDVSCPPDRKDKLADLEGLVEMWAGTLKQMHATEFPRTRLQLAQRDRDLLLSRDHVRAPAVRFRPALHAHSVQVDPGGAWTVMATGRPLRDWGFWVGRTWKRQRKYFRDHGHHPCD